MGIATVRPMSYFRTPQLDDVILAGREDILKKTEEMAVKYDGINADFQRYLSRPDVDEAKRKRDDLLREHEAVEDERRAALSKIREQAIADARAAWNAGNAFFAPVLFQQLARDGAGWEVALQEVTAVGWRLDSWQVIGAAPSPFESTVTLIQTLFVR